jgi:hypothetical protein
MLVILLMCVRHIWVAVVALDNTIDSEDDVPGTFGSSYCPPCFGLHIVTSDFCKLHRTSHEVDRRIIFDDSPAIVVHMPSTI